MRDACEAIRVAFGSKDCNLTVFVVLCALLLNQDLLVECVLLRCCIVAAARATQSRTLCVCVNVLPQILLLDANNLRFKPCSVWNVGFCCSPRRRTGSQMDPPTHTEITNGERKTLPNGCQQQHDITEKKTCQDAIDRDKKSTVIKQHYSYITKGTHQTNVAS